MKEEEAHTCRPAGLRPVNSKSISLVGGEWMVGARWWSAQFTPLGAGCTPQLLVMNFIFTRSIGYTLHTVARRIMDEYSNVSTLCLHVSEALLMMLRQTGLEQNRIGSELGELQRVISVDCCEESHTLVPFVKVRLGLGEGFRTRWAF